MYPGSSYWNECALTSSMTPQSICLIGLYLYSQRRKTTFKWVKTTVGPLLLSIRHLSYSRRRGGNHHEAANTA
jgi:hypothetical protein